MLSLRMLPARQGDALWIEWGKDPVRRMLVDMGTPQTGRALRQRLLALPEAQRRIELLVISHVDEDHVGGTLSALIDADPIPGLELADVWFNGWPHLQMAATGLESYGPVQGEIFGRWLESRAWNQAFAGKAVAADAAGPLLESSLPGGLKLTVLGPPRQRLHAFKDAWAEAVAEAVRKGRLPPQPETSGLESYGPAKAPRLDDRDDLKALAETAVAPDNSPANGSSIALLLEYEGERVLLGADAWGPDLLAALVRLGHGQPLALSAFKLPHHGSAANISRELVEAVDCPLWLFSTDGTRFRHPDAVAIARVICHSRHAEPELAFNVRSTYNGWWDRDDWRAEFNYRTRFGDADSGLELNLPPP